MRGEPILQTGRIRYEYMTSRLHKEKEPTYEALKIMLWSHLIDRGMKPIFWKITRAGTHMNFINIESEKERTDSYAEMLQYKHDMQMKIKGQMPFDQMRVFIMDIESGRKPREAIYSYMLIF